MKMLDMSASASLTNRPGFAARAGDATAVASLLAVGADANERTHLPSPLSP